MRPLQITIVSVLLLASRAWGDAGKPVAIRFWGGDALSFETYWNLSVAIDPPAGTGGGRLGVKPDLILFTGRDRNGEGAGDVAGEPPVLRPGEDGGAAPVDVTLDRLPNAPVASTASTADKPRSSGHGIRVRSSAPDTKEEKAGAAASLLVEVDGVRALVCRGPGAVRLAEAPAAEAGAAKAGGAAARVDVLLVPLSGGLSGAEQLELIAEIAPRFLVPFGYRPGDGRLEALLERLPGRFTVTRATGNTFAVTHGRGPTRERPHCVVLRQVPWKMPDELAALFSLMDAPVVTAREIFSRLSAAQMNHRPANGTHTARWNAEHIMGRELGFFTAVYSHVDPSVPHLDLNPAQMPPDYKPRHPDWTGEEEVKQVERAAALVRRFAYLLDGVDLDAKPEGSPWTVRTLCLTMEAHFNEHLGNVKKKLSLPDWPAR